MMGIFELEIMYSVINADHEECRTLKSLEMFETLASQEINKLKLNYLCP